MLRNLLTTLIMSTAFLALTAPAWAATPLPPAEALTATRTTYYHNDHAGNVRAESDRSGTLTATHRYEPFGLTLPDETLSAAAPRFGGKLRDPVSGLDDFGARDFGAQYGRFLSVDPVAFGSKALANPQDLNLYSYGLNNPLKYGDPTGRATEILQPDGSTITCNYTGDDIGNMIVQQLTPIAHKLAEANEWLNEKILTPLGPYNPELEFSMAVVAVTALGGKAASLARMLAEAAEASWTAGSSPFAGAKSGCMATLEMKRLLPAEGWIARRPDSFGTLADLADAGKLVGADGQALDLAISTPLENADAIMRASKTLPITDPLKWKTVNAVLEIGKWKERGWTMAHYGVTSEEVGWLKHTHRIVLPRSPAWLGTDTAGEQRGLELIRQRRSGQ